MTHHPPTMRAAVFAGPGRVEIDSVPVPRPGAGEVLLRVEGCGVCASNLEPWEGKPWFQYPFAPGAPGHEAYGTVEALGPGTSGVSPGQRVAFLSYHAYAEYVVARADAVVPIPPGPFPGEPLACALNVLARCGIEAGQTVAVVGTGFLGCLLVRLAAAAGACVIALSRRGCALELAKEQGAAETVALCADGEALGQVEALTEGKGCEVVIEATGREEPLDLAGRLTRERGRLVIAGYHQDGPRRINLQLWNWRGLDVINAHERDPAIYVRGLRAAVEAVKSGRIDPAPLLTHFLPLEELGAALRMTRERPGGFMKAIVTP